MLNRVIRVCIMAVFVVGLAFVASVVVGDTAEGQGNHPSLGYSTGDVGPYGRTCLAHTNTALGPICD